MVGWWEGVCSSQGVYNTGLREPAGWDDWWRLDAVWLCCSITSLQCVAACVCHKRLARVQGCSYDAMPADSLLSAYPQRRWL